MDLELMKLLTIIPMPDYDGTGYLCFIADSNVGFGDTMADAFNSWQRGEDIRKEPREENIL